MNASTKVVVGYVRVSTSQQVANGDGLADQAGSIRKWCTYEGLQLAAIEEDAGISGASMDNRPGFKRAIRAVLAGGSGSVLIVKKLDRLGRNAIDVQETLALLLDSGVRVVSISDSVDSGSGMGAALLKLLTGILATFAELEKETITTRMQDGRKRAKEQSRVYSAEASYGLRRVASDSKELCVDEDEVKAVARIRELRAEGLAYRVIGERLLAEGIKPRRSSSWAPSVVMRLAKGERKPDKKAKNQRFERARAAILADGQEAA